MLLAGLIFELVARLLWPDGILPERQSELRVQSSKERVLRPDALLGWSGMPSVHVVFDRIDYQRIVTHNSQGFRDRERSLGTPQGTVRILVFGDSMTWGWGVEDNETYPAVLEEMLHAEGFTVEVLNMGFFGYGLGQQYVLWQEVGKAYQPDIVLQGLFWNDLFETVSTGSSAPTKPYFRLDDSGNLVVQRLAQDLPEVREPSPLDRVKGWLHQYSYTYQLASAGIKAVPPFRALLTGGGLIAPVEYSVPNVSPNSTATDLIEVAEANQGIEVAQAILRSWKREVEEGGGTFLVVYLPDVHEVQEINAGFRTAMTRQKEAMDLPGLLGPASYLDLTEDFGKQNASSEPLYYWQAYEDLHYTATGQRLVAAGILQFLRESMPALLRAQGSIRGQN